MKNLLSIFFLLSILVSCNKEIDKPVAVKPVPEPAIKQFFKDVNSIVYRENGRASILIKIDVYKSKTNIDIDWGDGKLSKINYEIETIERSSLIEFEHYYEKNGIYNVNFKAANTFIRDSLTVEVNIKNYVPKPIADFSYEILEGGKVKFNNLSTSENIDQYYWGDQITINRSYLKDSEFIYELNGVYHVFLQVYDSFGRNATTTKKITITNAFPRELASFKGTIFGKEYEWIENGTDCETLMVEIDPITTSLLTSFYKYTPEKNFMINIGAAFKVSSSSNYNAVERYNTFKENLTLGIKNVNGGTADAWGASIRFESKEGGSLHTFGENSHIEILEIKETDQPILFDSVYPKAFWVTFKLKADFKELGKIDGILKIRYLIYKMM